MGAGNIKVGATVTTRRRPQRTGKVVEATGTRRWKVRFSDGSEGEFPSSALLRGTPATQARGKEERANENTASRFGRAAFNTPIAKRPVKHVSSHSDTSSSGEDSDGVEVPLESFASTGRTAPSPGQKPSTLSGRIKRAFTPNKNHNRLDFSLSSGSDTGSSSEQQYEFGDDGVEVRASTTRKAAPPGRKPKKPFLRDKLHQLLTPGKKKKEKKKKVKKKQKKKSRSEYCESSEGGGTDVSILYEPTGVEACLMSPIATTFYSDSDSDDSIADDPDAENEEDEVVAPEEQFFPTAADIEDPDAFRRAQRKNKFEQRRSELIDSGHTITKKITPSSTLEVGAKVETRKKEKATGRPRRGVITDKVSIDGSDKFTHWKVEFSRDGQPYFESLKPQQLKRLEVDTASQTYHWKAVESHIAKNPVKEYSSIGFISPGGDSGINFGDFDGDLNFTASNYSYPFAAAFDASLGDTERFVAKMNEAITRDNLARGGRGAQVFEKGEWMKGIGILLHAVELGEGGVEKMFPPQRKNGSATDGPNLPCDVRSSAAVPQTVMTKSRFKQFLAYFHFSFTGDDPTDPYNPAIGFVNDFNARRHELLASSSTKVMDELMSPYKPRTTPTGGLPNISYVQRKPEPLGVEAKALICAKTSK